MGSVKALKKANAIMCESEWSAADQQLLESGYLRFKDGRLIKWSPPEKPGPFVSQHMDRIPITFDEIVADNIAEWNRLNPGK